MIVADQIKVLDRKIKQNKVQYDLDRLAAKISAYFSNNLDKYEYLIGQDLGYKSSVVEKARFDYSPLSKFLNKGLKEENKREGPLKILKNIEDNTEEQLKAIKSDKKWKNDLFDKHLIWDAIVLIKEIKSIEENVDYGKLSFTGGNKKVYGLDSFKTFEKLLKYILSIIITIDKTKIKQNKFDEQLDELRAYTPRGKYIGLKESVFKNAENFFDGWKKLVNGFKNGILLLSKKDVMKTDKGDQQPDSSDTPKEKKVVNF